MFDPLDTAKKIIDDLVKKEENQEFSFEQSLPNGQKLLLYAYGEMIDKVKKIQQEYPGSIHVFEIEAYSKNGKHLGYKIINIQEPNWQI